jgi:hypothetical protein
MFFRKENKSGVISIQVIDKSSGKLNSLKLLEAQPILRKLSNFFNRGSNGSGSIRDSLRLIFKMKNNCFPDSLQASNRLWSMIRIYC